jgi:C_GCAxxG_C_C family probable redox protein
MATPFGGGLSRFGTVCGAVVGGAMAIGFCFGRTRAEEKDKREKTYSKVQEMLRGFEKEFGTLQCKGLIQLDLLDPADRKKFQELKLTDRCAGFVAFAVAKVRELVKE